MLNDFRSEVKRSFRAVQYDMVRAKKHIEKVEADVAELRKWTQEQIEMLKQGGENGERNGS